MADVSEDKNLKRLFTARETCRLCGSRRLEIAIPMRPIPIVSPNVGSTDALASVPAGETAPLEVYLCEDCGQLQLRHVIEPRLQYNTFLYETSVSLGLADHFDGLAGLLVSQHGLRQGNLVFEIGSNDGTLLRFFQKRGMRVLGIDPARKIAEAATRNGVPTIADFFTSAKGREIAARHGSAKVIVSNNTMANIDDLDDMIDGVKACLAPDGVFVIETQYALDVLQKTLLDVIYHEHLSYFLIRPLDEFFAARGLQIVSAERIWPKGGSIRVTVQHADGPHKRGTDVEELVALEKRAGLFDRKSYEGFSRRIAQIKDGISRIITETGKTGGDVAAYGASVGCVTLINQFDLGRRLAFVVDDSPLKKQLIGPDYSIPVVSRDELARRMPALVIVLAWRYASAIAEKNTPYLKGGGRFLVPLPDIAFVP